MSWRKETKQTVLSLETESNHRPSVSSPSSPFFHIPDGVSSPPSPLKNADKDDGKEGESEADKGVVNKEGEELANLSPSLSRFSPNKCLSTLSAERLLAERNAAGGDRGALGESWVRERERGAVGGE